METTVLPAGNEPSLTIGYVRVNVAIQHLWKRNPKLHDLSALAGLFQKHGFRDAPAFDTSIQEGGGIVDGNGRIETLAWMHDQRQDPPAGILLDADGMWCVPVQFGVDASSVAAAEAYAIDANNAMLAGGSFSALDMAQLWDRDKYLEVLTELAEAGELPQSVDGDDLDALLAGLVDNEPVADPGAQVDKAAELQEKWQVERGQIWEIPSQSVQGKFHRVMCGDSTCEEDVGRLMPRKPRFGIHDPPYGISLDQGWLSRVNAKAGKPRNIATDESVVGDDGTLDISCAFEFDKWLVWGFPYLAAPDMTGWLVWDKWPGVEGGGLGNPVEMASTNLWDGFKLKRVMWGGYYRAAGETREPHPTQKPIGIIEPIVQLCGDSGTEVADLFCGSGTTLIACEQTGRLCFGMEIAEKYVAVTLERLQGMDLSPQLVQA